MSDLLSAVKNDPYAYADKEVQVKGTWYKDDGKYGGDIVLLGTEEPKNPSAVNNTFYSSKNRINIIVTDDILYSVAESGDYILVCGIVKMTNGKVYLDNCTYTLIKAAELI